MGIDAASYRHIVGHFATGVTVVTTDVDGWLHGTTANAVTSVSLEPLLLLVVIDKSANAHQQLSKAGHFGVNFLTAEQEELSSLFAGSFRPERGRLQGVSHHPAPNGSPMLPGCLASLECTVREQLPGGDHTIFVGEVVHGDVHRDAPPLLFYQGKYRRLQA